MTLSVRNGLLALGFILLTLLVLGYGALSVFLVSREGWAAQIGPVTLVWLLAETALALSSAVVGFSLIRRAFRKSAAPELFFFSLFLVTLGAEGMLLVQAWIHFESYPSWFSGLLTRVIWAFRFSGLFLLFCGSLFAFEFPYRKYGNLVFGSVLAGIFLATMVPLHSTSARNHLLFAIGDASGVVLVTTLLAAVTATNYLWGATRTGSPDRAWARAGAALSFLAGWTLAIVIAPWATVFVVPGIVLGAWKAEQTALAR
jgi:hypothetical protein